MEEKIINKMRKKMKINNKRSTPSLTLGQFPDVARVVGDIVESGGGVHDGLDTQDALKLQ